MLNKLLLIVVCLAASLFLSAQNKYYTKGYIIKNNNDTINGYLQRLSDEDLEKEVHFKVSLTDNDVTIFSPSDLLGFYLDEDAIKFESVPVSINLNNKIKTGKRFAVLILSGFANLYKLKLNSTEKEIVFESSNIYIAKKEGKYTQLDQTEELEGAHYTLTKNYIDSLVIFFADCNAIDAEMINKASFTDDDMIELFSIYNKSINPAVKSVIHTYISPSQIKEGFEISYPFFTGRGVSGVSGFSFGYFVDILEPSISKNISVMLGLNYLSLNYTGQDTASNYTSYSASYLRFHLLGSINLTDKKKIIPFINFGSTLMDYLNYPTNFTIFLSCGAGCYIGKRLIASVLYNNIVPDFLYTNTKLFDFKLSYRLK